MSGDGKRAVSGSDDKTLKVWDLTTGGLLRTLEGHAGSVTAVAMSGDGTRAVSGSDDETLKVWDLTTGRLLRTLEGHAGGHRRGDERRRHAGRLRLPRRDAEGLGPRHREAPPQPPRDMPTRSMPWR